MIMIIIDQLYGYTLDYMHSNSKSGSNKEMYDLCMNDKYDIIILGSSRARHHYIPQIIEDSLSMSCYNGGLDGNGIILMSGITELILQRYNPKLIIYDIENAFDINEYLPDNKCLRYIKPLKPFFRNDSIGNLIKTISDDEYIYIHSGLYRYNSIFISVFKDFLINNKQPTKKGYSPLYGCMKKDVKVKDADGKVVVDSLKYNSFTKFVDRISEKKILLIVVASPKYKKDFADLIPLVEYCKKKNIPFVDYYNHDYFMANNSLFKEPMHLNDDGARKFTQYLVSDLLKFCRE